MQTDSLGRKPLTFETCRPLPSFMSQRGTGPAAFTEGIAVPNLTSRQSITDADP
jgi:hypothetical protein